MANAPQRPPTTLRACTRHVIHSVSAVFRAPAARTVQGKHDVQIRRPDNQSGQKLDYPRAARDAMRGSRRRRSHFVLVLGHGTLRPTRCVGCFFFLDALPFFDALPFLTTTYCAATAPVLRTDTATTHTLCLHTHRPHLTRPVASPARFVHIPERLNRRASHARASAPLRWPAPTPPPRAKLVV